MPTLKRKHADEDSPSDSPTQALPQSPRRLAHQPKRRRYDLSRNLSRLSLVEPRVQSQPVIQEPQNDEETTPSFGENIQVLDISAWNTQSQPYGDTPTMDMDVPIYDGGRPVIEEPTEKSPPTREVHMHGSSSYEPEKDRKSLHHHSSVLIPTISSHTGIIITDLDSSEDESDANESSADNSGFTVSPAFLSHIQTSKPPLLKPVVPSMDSDAESKALVLFRPSPWTSENTQQLDNYYSQRDNEKQGTEMDLSTTPQAEEDSDAMEIE